MCIIIKLISWILLQIKCWISFVFVTFTKVWVELITMWSFYFYLLSRVKTFPAFRSIPMYVPAHRYFIVRNYLAKKSVTRYKHPPHFFDLTSADFFLFSWLKTFWREANQSEDSEVFQKRRDKRIKIWVNRHKMSSTNNLNTCRKAEASVIRVFRRKIWGFKVLSLFNN